MKDICELESVEDFEVYVEKLEENMLPNKMIQKLIHYTRDGVDVNPEYLMLWFRRAEFDRECWFHTDGSVRGGITWDEILEMTVPVPSIEAQNEIVKSYNDITHRIQVKKDINDNLAA